MLDKLVERERLELPVARIVLVESASFVRSAVFGRCAVSSSDTAFAHSVCMAKNCKRFSEILNRFSQLKLTVFACG